jgi:histidinol-phosphate aminotransferase
VFPTQTNFVLVRVRDANALSDGLRARRILIKNLHGWHPLLSNCLRITVGTPEENDVLLAACTDLCR